MTHNQCSTGKTMTSVWGQATKHVHTIFADEATRQASLRFDFALLKSTTATTSPEARSFFRQGRSLPRRQRVARVVRRGRS